jgi:hypothetical protein
MRALALAGGWRAPLSALSLGTNHLPIGSGPERLLVRSQASASRVNNASFWLNAVARGSGARRLGGGGDATGRGLFGPGGRSVRGEEHARLGPVTDNASESIMFRKWQRLALGFAETRF